MLSAGGRNRPMSLLHVRPGPRVEGPRVEGPRVEGPRVEGPRVEGPRVEGPRVEVGSRIFNPGVRLKVNPARSV